MMTISIKRLLLLIMLVPTLVCSQPNLDSLWNTWQDAEQHDTARVLALNYFTWQGVMYNDPDSAFKLCQLQHDFSVEKGLEKYQANALMGQGAAKFIGGSLDEALKYYEKSLALFEKLRNKKAIGAILNNLAPIYHQQGNYAKALNYYQRSLKIKEEFGDSIRLVTTLGNIAIIFQEQGEFDKAIEYYNQAKDYYLHHENYDALTGVLNNIGTVYYEEQKYDQALNNFQRIEDYSTNVDDQFLEASRLENISRCYLALKKYDLALDFGKRAKELSKSIGDQDGLNTATNCLGNIYLAMGQYDKAQLECTKNYRMSEELGISLSKNEACECLYRVFKARGNMTNALKYYEEMIGLRDSIYSDENTRKLARLELQYEYDKKAAADSIQAAEAQKVSQAQIAAQEAQLEQEKTQRYALFGGIALLALFGGIMFNRFRVIKRQHDIIDEQKSLVEKQKGEVEEAHDLLTEKNQEILDSIIYAKRIQTAILPPDRIWAKQLNQSFVLYKPKDVVAGDFYWMETVSYSPPSQGGVPEGGGGSLTNQPPRPADTPPSKGREGDIVYFAAADCTGHGVPGAMVSVICNNGLNRSVREFGLREPGEILDKTRELVIKEFEKSEEEVKDGMDISLCAFNTNCKELKWAGANNPLWIVRKGAEEIEEIKADKQPIGKYHMAKPFNTHEVNLLEGDTIYVFSDGYPDQFGGERGKKYKSGKFKRTLLELAQKPISEQKQILDTEFENWRGDIEQIDDVCVIGVRI